MQVVDFFSHSGTKLILSVILNAIICVALKLFVFTKRRRPSGVGSRRGRYNGRRRR